MYKNNSYINIPEYVTSLIIEYSFVDRSYYWRWRLALNTLSWRYFNLIKVLYNKLLLNSVMIYDHITSDYLSMTPRHIYTSLIDLNKLLKDTRVMPLLISPNTPLTSNNIQSLVIEERGSPFSMVGSVDIKNFVEHLSSLRRFTFESSHTTIHDNTLLALMNNNAPLEEIEYLSPLQDASLALASLVSARASSLTKLAFGSTTKRGDDGSNERFIQNSLLSQATLFTRLTSLKIQCYITDSSIFFISLTDLSSLTSLSLLQCQFKNETMAKRQMVAYLSNNQTLKILKTSIMLDNSITSSINSAARLRKIHMSTSPTTKANQTLYIQLETSVQSLKITSMMLSDTFQLDISTDIRFNQFRELTINLVGQQGLSCYEDSLAHYLENNSSCRRLTCQYSKRIISSLRNNKSIESITLHYRGINNDMPLTTALLALNDNQTILEIILDSGTIDLKTLQLPDIVGQLHMTNASMDNGQRRIHF
ncbi:hypothetical protein SAMD00019534_029230, partial [Acytostelium subglobosum LB1]|uniref:hypothetical protein n=1 Tax=Acytostelium subglobosum LB1 TaxID=1410327 RepID=UPI000644ABC4